MNEQRRTLLKSIAAGGILAATTGSSELFSNYQDKAILDAGAESNNLNSLQPVKGGIIEEKKNLIIPKGLSKGSKIVVVSPASPISSWNLTSGVRALEGLGYKVEIGPIARNQRNSHRYFAASDKDRADELMEYFERDDVDAIVTGRGGYGVMRILNMLDYDIIRRNPKILVGFSDITALLFALYSQAKLVSYHGPVASVTFDSFTTRNFHTILDSSFINENYSIKLPEIRTITEGSAEGIIQGGNLRMINSTMGTPYEIDTKDAILFIEDVSEHAYEVDRMLTQLLISGKIQQCKAIVLGKFKNLHTRRSFYPNRSLTIMEVIEDVLKPLGIPCVLNAPFGHVVSKLTLPIGLKASINTESKEFKILENTVS